MKKIIIILSLVTILPHIAISQDIPVYRDNRIVGYLYTEIPTVNLDDYYLLDTITVFGKKIIVQTKAGYFGTDGGIDLFAHHTYIDVEKMSNDTVIIKFDNQFGLSARKDEMGEIRIYNLFSFNRNNRDKICVTEIDRLLDDKIIITHNEHDTFEFPACNHEPIISLLIEYAPFKDTNPVHQEEADAVNSIFIRAVHSYNLFDETEKQYFRTKAFSLLYDNSVADFEDAVDYDRMAIRKSLCYMTLALLSDRYRFQSFTNDAINTLSDIQPERRYQQTALVLLSEILMMYRFEDISAKAVEEKQESMHHFLKTNIEYFDKEFVKKIMEFFKNLHLYDK
jgi:hypothetical protein